MLELYKYTDKEQKQLLDSIVILADTREHDGKNSHILKYFDDNNIKWSKKKLPYADYSFMIPANDDLNIPRDLDFSSKVVIERKANLEELSGNLTSNSERSRIKKEFALAPDNKIVIIENASYANMVDGRYNTNYDKKSFWASYHSIWHEFNIPIIFMPNPAYTPVFIYGYFYYYMRNLLK